MSTPSMNQKNVDFSRKCRDRVNFFFQKLKITLKKIPIYRYQSKSLNWNSLTQTLAEVKTDCMFSRAVTDQLIEAYANDDMDQQTVSMAKVKS